MTSSLPPTVAAHVPTGLLVDGGWRPASGGATFPVHDPGTTEVLFDVADATSDDAVAALTAADEAFATYRTTAPYERSELLRAVYDAITAHAEDGSDPLCVRTVETLAGIFGSVAGDLVLSLGGWDGVYLTGGVLPFLLPWLHRGGFRERFEAKGRFRETMERVPTSAITHPEPGLLGAAAIALRAAGLPLHPQH